MTIAVTSSYTRAPGNGVATVYNFAFKIFAASDLVVTDIVDATGVPTTRSDYTVAISATTEGGTVTFATAPLTGHTIDIRSLIPLDQPTSITNQGPFSPNVHETTFDRLDRQGQDTRRLATNSIRIPDYEAPRDMTLPKLADIAGKYGAYDVLGKPIGASGTGNDSSLRTDLAISTTGSEGGRLVAFKRTEAGASARTVQSKLLEWVTPLDFGAVGDGVADDAAAIQAAYTALAATGGTVYFPSKYVFRSTANINVPVGDGNTVDTMGASRASGGILFDGAAVTTGLTFTGSGLTYAGFVNSMRIRGTGGAVRGVTASNCDQPRVYASRFSGFSGAAIAMFGCIVSEISAVLVTGCGSATEGSIEIDGIGGAVGSTTFKASHLYISAGNTTVGGLIINRTYNVTIIAGAIESCGTPLRVGNKADSTVGCLCLLIHGMDLENPGNGNPYIEIGQGLSSVFVNSIDVRGCNGSPSGTATVLCGVRLYRCNGAMFGPNNWTLTAGSTATYILESTGNFGVIIEGQRQSFGVGAKPWVTVNSTQVKAAGPHIRWKSDEVMPGYNPASAASLTGTTPSILIDSVQGGYYGHAVFANGGATTVTQLLDGEAGMRCRLGATNGNTTLTQGTGAGQFDMIAGGNYTLAGGQFLDFVHNGTCWKEIRKSELTGSAAYDPPSLADGAGATTTVTVNGASLGQYALCSFSLDLQGISVTAWVSAANTVSVRFQNESGGALDLASGTLRAKVYS